MILPVLLLVQLVALNPAESYNEANHLYEEGDYSEAIELYEDALGSARDSRVLYNLGNAYFKAGRVGKAVVNYRRAWVLSPRDPDIRANLDFARSYRADRVDVGSNPPIVLLVRIVRYFSIQETLAAASILFVSALVLLSAAAVRRRPALGCASLCLFIIFLYLLISWGSWRAVLRSRNAVVVVPEVTAYSGPGTEYREVLQVHDGLEARIRDERHGYVLIQIPGGLGGWVEESAVEEVHPPQKW
jgi:tetratricopeptide (TPR) repeat protein